jgi:phosphonate degradation associated HDIG domain protein
MRDLTDAPTVGAAVDAVIELFDRLGSARYDEAVSQAEHAAQSAQLARREDGRPSVVAAALLHDIGHLLAPGGGCEDRRHEAVGAAALARWFPLSVTAPIALHVAAKRYLCAVEPGYHDELSPASQRSLRLQGGPMSAVEAVRFADHPQAGVAVALRRWDDRAKVPGLEVTPVEGYRSLLVTVSRR